MIDLRKCKMKFNSKELHRELQKGSKVEMEHTNNPWKANLIARQHICEDSKYYTKLKKVGL